MDQPSGSPLKTAGNNAVALEVADGKKSLKASVILRGLMIIKKTRAPQKKAVARQPSKESIESEGYDLNYFLKGSLTKPLKRVYLFFGVRQGAIIIALNEMLWMAFLIYLLMLAMTHFHVVPMLVDSEAKTGSSNHSVEVPQLLRAASYPFVIQRGGNTPTNEHNEQVKDRIHVVFGTILLGLVVFSIDYVCSMLLFIGALKRSRPLLIPWMTMRMIEIMTMCVTMMVVAVYYAVYGPVFARVTVGGLLLLSVMFYHWLAIFSLYELLYANEGKAKEGQLKHLVHESTTTLQVQLPEMTLDDEKQKWAIVPRIVQHGSSK